MQVEVTGSFAAVSQESLPGSWDAHVVPNFCPTLRLSPAAEASRRGCVGAVRAPSVEHSCSSFHLQPVADKVRQCITSTPQNRKPWCLLPIHSHVRCLSKTQA